MTAFKSSPLPFPVYHLLGLLNAYDQQTLPIDVFMNRYFRAHKAIGSKDKKFISENAYALLRWRRTLEALTERDKPTWPQIWQIFEEGSWRARKEELPPHLAWGFPEELFQCLLDSWGWENTLTLCACSNEEAPTTVRVNLIKTTRESLLRSWQEPYGAYPCSQSSVGITFPKRFNFFQLPEFKKGLFEVQDEGSQLVAELVVAKPGQQVLDFCSGAGGKALAMAPLLEGRGQLYLHDIRLKALGEAKKRLKRAGIENAQVLNPASPGLAKLKRNMDWVLVDAPCTGTGTLRRNPDMKWKFSTELLKRLVGEQRKIFEQALSYVKPGGHIVYATCSLLKEENQEQAAHFLRTYPLETAQEPFQSLPSHGGMDGFYGAVFRKKS